MLAEPTHFGDRASSVAFLNALNLFADFDRTRSVADPGREFVAQMQGTASVVPARNSLCLAVVRGSATMVTIVHRSAL